MQFTIACETFSRMAEIGRYPIEDLDHYFKSLYFERHNNQLFLVACNRRLLAVENLGINVGPNETCAIDISNDHLIKHCDDVTQYNGMLEIMTDDKMRWAFVKSNMGFNAPNCYMALPKDHKFQQWRDLVPDELPKKSSGAMFWHAHLIHTLAVASPSGMLAFSEFIDTSQAILVTDAHSDNWFALFMALPQPEWSAVPARIPTWINAE